MSIRLNKATKECNVGLQTAVEFLQKKGFSDVEANPNGRITDEQYVNRMFLRDAMLRNGFEPIFCEWWHFTLKDEPYPDTYFEFPVSSAYLRQ